MKVQPDQEIIRAARDIIEKRYVPGKHCMGSAIGTKSGNMFVDVHVGAS